MRQPVPFGKYLLLDRVSVGGMAEVFKAKSYGVEGFEKIIAIKRILPAMGEDRDFIKMFIDEAKIAGQLSHANICHIFELGKIQGSHFIAMEYIWGKDLLQIQNRLRKVAHVMPVGMACYVMSKVCEGLDYAHRKKDAMGRPLEIIHRDCSPQNILVSYEGEVKIIDFGIARAASRSSRTNAGVLKGKFGYMSPEQVRGLPLDHRSDLFAIGTCFYESLTGERLFQGESDFSTLEKVRNADVRPPSQLNQNIPPEVEGIVMRALARDPKARFESGAEMHAALQSFLTRQAVPFTSKSLADWLKAAFREDLEREKQLMEEYKRIGRDGLIAGAPQARARVDLVAELGQTPAIDGDPTALGGPSFEDMTQDELDAWLNALPAGAELPSSDGPARRAPHGGPRGKVLRAANDGDWEPEEAPTEVFGEIGVTPPGSEAFGRAPAGQGTAAPPNPSLLGAPPAVPPRGMPRAAMPPPGAPPRSMSAHPAPPGMAPPGMAPPGMPPRGMSPHPGMAQPGMAPPGAQRGMAVNPGLPPPGMVQPGGPPPRGMAAHPGMIPQSMSPPPGMAPRPGMGSPPMGPRGMAPPGPPGMDPRGMAPPGPPHMDPRGMAPGPPGMDPRGMRPPAGVQPPAQPVSVPLAGGPHAGPPQRHPGDPAGPHPGPHAPPGSEGGPSSPFYPAQQPGRPLYPEVGSGTYSPHAPPGPERPRPGGPSRRPTGFGRWRRATAARDVAIGCAIAALVVAAIVSVKFLAFGDEPRAEAEVAATGTILVVVRDAQPAEVTVDGKIAGAIRDQSPLTLSALPSGSHAVLVTRAGAPPCERKVELGSRHVEVVECSFPKAPTYGRLILEGVEPKHRVFVDDQEISREAAREPLHLTPGVEHTVQIKTGAAAPEMVDEFSIELEPGQEIRRPIKTSRTGSRDRDRSRSSTSRSSTARDRSGDAEDEDEDDRDLDADSDADPAPRSRTRAVAPSAPVSPTAPGSFSAFTKPFARVFIDGKDTGKMTPIPPRSAIALPPGQHDITFVVGEQRFLYRITIAPGKNENLVKTLRVE